MNSHSTPPGNTRIRRFLERDALPGRTQRTIVGLLLALLLLPFLLGVMACLPVPVGDPEKSHVDAKLSGVWRLTDAEDSQMLLVLDPFDKRTWLMTLISLGNVEDVEAVEENDSGPEEAPRAPIGAADTDRFKVDAVGVYKCWLTRMKGETFMTWESKTLSETLPEMVPEQWWVFRVRKSGSDTYYLDGFDYSIDGLDKVSTREEAEKIIRRHLGDPGFFKEKDAPRLDRLSESEVAHLAWLLRDFGIRDNL